MFLLIWDEGEDNKKSVITPHKNRCGTAIHEKKLSVPSHPDIGVTDCVAPELHTINLASDYKGLKWLKMIKIIHELKYIVCCSLWPVWCWSNEVGDNFPNLDNWLLLILCSYIDIIMNLFHQFFRAVFRIICIS